MPRVARIGWPGRPHHVTQRGNNHQSVSFVDDDLLRTCCEHSGVGVRGYGLMANHVHVVAVPELEEALAQPFGRTHGTPAGSRW
jgi:putative transposase